MTNRVGNKDVARQRGKAEKAHMKASNKANEAEKKAASNASIAMRSEVRQPRRMGLNINF
jgi:hypothetical protein